MHARGRPPSSAVNRSRVVRIRCSSTTAPAASSMQTWVSCLCTSMPIWSTAGLPFAAASTASRLWGYGYHVRVEASRFTPSICLPFEEQLVARARRRRVAGVSNPLPTPEDLVVTKAVAHRARDLGDIEGIVAAHPKLDRRRIRRIVGEFATVLEAPEILEDLDRALGRSRPRRR